MAHTLLDRAWAVPLGVLRGVAKIVLVNFADRADAKGEGIYPSINRIAAETGCDRVTVIRTIKQLLAKGFVRAVRVRSRGNIEYAINVDALTWERDQPLARPTGCTTPPVAPRHRLHHATSHGERPVAPRHSDRLHHATRTVSEPKDSLSVADAPGKEIDRVLAELRTVYAAHRSGAVLVINRKRDVPNVRCLIGEFDADRVPLLFRELLTMPKGVDAWIDGSDHGIGVLTRKASMLDARLRGVKPETAKAAAEPRRVVPDADATARAQREQDAAWEAEQERRRERGVA